MLQNPNVVVLMGPTGVGKSALALDLAKTFDGEIISADSRQVYVGMDIGTEKTGHRKQATGNRDDPMLVEQIPHYLIDILTPDRRYSAAEFRDDARRIVADIHRRGRLPFVVGGTGFYIRVLAGHRSLPNIPPDSAFRAWAEEQPLAALVRELQQRAPDLFARVDNLRNKRRVVRALEIARARGNRQQAAGSSRPHPVPCCLFPVAYTFLKLALLPPPHILRERLAHRVEDEFRRGFVEEVRMLVQQYGTSAPGLQAVGYRQVLPYLREEVTLEETKQTVFRAHRDYARRQLTWLKKEPDLARVTSRDDATRAIAAFLNRKDAG